MFVPIITCIGTSIAIYTHNYVNFVESMLDVFKFVVRACLLCALYFYVINYEKSYGLLN